MTKSVFLLAAAAFFVLPGPAASQRAAGYSYATGQELYQHICQGCHMPAAEGAVGAGAYPALAKDQRLRSALYPAMILLRGQKAMPSFADLTDAQIAAVTNYVRSHFGNDYADAISAEQVTKLRPQQIRRDAQRPG